MSLIFFSITQIFLSDQKIEHSLKEWNEKVASISIIPSHASAAGVDDERENNAIQSNTPKQGEVVGKIIFPKLSEEFPIIEGTNEEQLSRGVGHYIGSVLPGMKDNSVLAGHRDGVFQNLNQLNNGDLIKVETITGVYTYKISKQQIVDENDRTIIVPTNEATLTLVTCYPFNFIGPAPKRYIITAHLTE
ncbi:class D sortase [Bacillus sp. Marseille-P3661]|uniref:class D sortase n=1 Tax=Bacillus sp. Marseille-P3661 TaxID=1936234 RepID=UPI0021551452|nr:class D sortase [Bacillus sp. Marseille-P3661]